MSGKWFKPVPYGVRRDDHLIDMDEVARIARETKPKLILAGGTAYSASWDFKRFREIADEVGAYLMVDMAHFAGLVAGRRRIPRHCRMPMSSPPRRTSRCAAARRHDPDQRRGHRQEDELRGVPRSSGRAADARHRRQGGRVRRSAAAQLQAPTRKNVVENARTLAETLKAKGLDIVSGGTDNHLMLVDLRPKRLNGKVSETALGRAHITCNKNGIPFDPEKPMVTSGIRLGTPACTTRGFGMAEFKQVGEMIVEVLDVLSQKGVDEDS